MKRIIEKMFIGGLAAVFIITPASAAELLLANGSFEEPANVGSTDGWAINDGIVEVGIPVSALAQDGQFAVKLSNFSPGFGFSFISQRGFDASPGDEFYASAYILTEQQVVDGAAARFMKLAFYDSNQFPIPDDTAPASISKGRLGACPFPGVDAGPPFIDSASPLNTWLLTQAQAVAASDTNAIEYCDREIAPPGTVEVGVFLFNINLTGTAAPIWYDNVILARLDPDDDGDRLENGVDSDPLNPSFDFSDGITSGSVIQDDNQILTIDDEPAPDGVRITGAPGSGSPARVRVCNESATLTIKPNNELVVTCGSVILTVEAGPAVTMEFDLNGEPATVEVPPDYTVTFAPEAGMLAVDSTAADPQPVILTVGESSISIVPGEEIDLPTMLIDIKPGSDPNCFNINGEGVIPVAILGSETLDVGEVDQSSLAFSGLDVRIKGNGDRSCGMDDTNADGSTDLVCHFEDDPLGWSPGSASATLSGALLDGTPISGTDSICIVP